MARLIILLSMLSVLFALVGTPTLAQTPATERLKEEYSFESFQRMVGEGSSPYGTLDAQQLEKYHEFKMQREMNRMIHVLVLSAVAIGSLALVLFRIGWKEVSAGRQIVNLTGLVLIIYGTIVLTLMAETEQQLTAAIGILGAVAGYLFGTIRTPATGGQRPSEAQADSKSSSK